MRAFANFFARFPTRRRIKEFPTFATLAAVVFRIVSNSLGSVFQKRLAARGRRPFFVNATTFFLLTLACVGPALSFDSTGFGPIFWRDVVVSGVLCAVGNACLVAALGRGELSILGPINAWKAVVGLIFAFFLLGEAPTFPALFGVFLIGVGSYFVLDASPERFSFRLLFQNSAIRLRVAALILTALEAIFIKKIVLAAGPTTAFFLWSATGAVFSTLSLGVAAFLSAISPRFASSTQSVQSIQSAQAPQLPQTSRFFPPRRARTRRDGALRRRNATFDEFRLRTARRRARVGAFPTLGASERPSRLAAFSRTRRRQKTFRRDDNRPRRKLRRSFRLKLRPFAEKKATAARKFERRPRLVKPSTESRLPSAVFPFFPLLY